MVPLKMSVDVAPLLMLSCDCQKRGYIFHVKVTLSLSHTHTYETQHHLEFPYRWICIVYCFSIGSVYICPYYPLQSIPQPQELLGYCFIKAVRV